MEVARRAGVPKREVYNLVHGGDSMSERITTVRNEGLAFDVLDEGPLDGAPVVLLHGFPERSSTWRHVAPILHDAGLRTLALDQRGYSPGARPRRRSAYKMHHLAGDVAALIGAVGGPVHLVGHDWGAAVGWAVAAHGSRSWCAPGRRCRCRTRRRSRGR